MLKKEEIICQQVHGQLLNIKVILDDNLVYEGMVEDAPEEIKAL